MNLANSVTRWRGKVLFSLPNLRTTSEKPGENQPTADGAFHFTRRPINPSQKTHQVVTLPRIEQQRLEESQLHPAPQVLASDAATESRRPNLPNQSHRLTSRPTSPDGLASLTPSSDAQTSDPCTSGCPFHPFPALHFLHHSSVVSTFRRSPSRLYVVFQTFSFTYFVFGRFVTLKSGVFHTPILPFAPQIR